MRPLLSRLDEAEELAGQSVEEIDRSLDGFAFARLRLFDLDVELIFESHHQLDDRQAVGAQLVKGLIRRDLGDRHTQLVSNNLDRDYC